MISCGLGRLDERKRRKEFILERNLLYPNHFEKDLSPEERALCRRYDVFMRFHSKEEHEDLLQTVISEHRTLKRIQELKVLVTCFATLNLRCYLISYSLQTSTVICQGIIISESKWGQLYKLQYTGTCWFEEGFASNKFITI